MGIYTAEIEALTIKCCGGKIYQAFFENKVTCHDKIV
jgi:hypothetical protein